MKSDCEIKFLQVKNGDSILIRFLGNDNKFHNLLIDGGLSDSYNDNLKTQISEISERNEFIDLLAITHIDKDHIEGILKFISDKEIDKSVVHKYWFNSGKLLAKFFNTKHLINREIRLEDNTETKISLKQGVTLESFLEQEVNKEKWHNEPIYFKQSSFVDEMIDNNTVDLYGAKITILSPNENRLKKLNDVWIEKTTKISGRSSDYDKSIKYLQDIKEEKSILDKEVANGSSIAFIFELNNNKILLLSDAHIDIIYDSLIKMGYSEENKLQLYLVKLSHHGSKRNISSDFLKIIDCHRFVITTDGSLYNLPNKKTLAMILSYCKPSSEDKISFYFNYSTKNLSKIFNEEDKEINIFDYQLFKKTDILQCLTFKF